MRRQLVLLIGAVSLTAALPSLHQQQQMRKPCSSAVARRPMPRPPSLHAATTAATSVNTETIKSPMGGRVYVSILFAFCTLFSLVTDMLTKQVLANTNEWPGLTLTITFMHFSVSAMVGALVVALSRAWGVLSGRTASHSSSAADKDDAISYLPLLRAAVPLGICQLGGFLCTNLSLKFVPVSFSHTVKACECLFTAALAFVLLRQRLNGLAYAALVPTAGGVALSAASELHFNPIGFFAAMGSNAFFAGRSVLSARMLRTHTVGAAALYWVLCCLASLMMLPLVLLHGQPWRLFAPERGPLMITLLAGGCGHFVYNLLSFQILEATNPVNHVVLHALRRIMVIGGSSLLTGQRLSGRNWLGVALASSGVLTYALAT